jgi:GNAT superfamily N-acetyltransferase
MAGMSLSAAAVAAASAAWIWIPETGATVVETDEYTIIELPDWYEPRLTVPVFRPAGPGGLAEAVERTMERARDFGWPEARWTVRLGDPAELGGELRARGGQAEIVLDVLAADLDAVVPTVEPPVVEVTLKWVSDFETARDGWVLGSVGFGGEIPPDHRIELSAERDAMTVAAGEGGTLVAYVDGRAAGSGGVTLVDGVARLWGGVVLPTLRGRGVYRAVLAARLAYAVENGAGMALVRGRADTSGPILRRAGFTAFGQETVYRVPLWPA